MTGTTTVRTPGRHVDVPDQWSDAGWERPYAFARAVSEIPLDPALTRTGSRLAPVLPLWTDVTAALRRQSLRAAEPGIERSAFTSLLRTAYGQLAAEPFMFGGVVTQGVEGWADAAWSLENGPRHLEVQTATEHLDLLGELGQGQGWVSGPGVLFLLGVNWAFARAQAVPADLAYAHAFVACGRIGHGILLEGQRHGLKARMTPALKESVAATLLQLDDTRDCLYLLKLARPRES